jgi:DNA-binding beta-propeller fold protein YncE
MKQSLALTLFLATSSLFAELPALRLVQTITLTNVEGRIDHLAVDVSDQRLFVAALGNNSVEVVDLRAGKHISLPGFRHPQGVAWILERNKLFVASGDDGTVKVFDGKSYKLQSTLGGLDDADNVRYDSRAKRVYVGYGSGALAIIDATNATLGGDIKLAGHPESFQLERNGPRIFVNVPTAKQVAVLDRVKCSVIVTWPVVGAGANFPMALNEENHRLYVACRKPPTLLVLNTDSGATIASVSIDADADDIFYDAKRHRIYISCGSGFVAVLDADSLKTLETIPTARGARTSLFAPELDRLYLALPKRDGQSAEVWVFEAVGDNRLGH